LYAGVKTVTLALQQLCEQARTAELKLAQAETVSKLHRTTCNLLPQLVID
jgi:hypothetical protein